MEEPDAQPLPLPEPEKEAPASGAVGRCGRHPAQPVAGVCSACLTERLSSVRSPVHPEIVEVADPDPDPDPGRGGPSCSGADRQQQQQQGKLRKTLGLLFQMDDDHSDSRASSTKAQDPQSSFQADPGGAASNPGTKPKRGSWLRSIFPKKGPRRRAHGKEEDPPRPSVEEGSLASVAADPAGDASPQVERRASFRRSCEWMVCRDPPTPGTSRGEPPRHSWDGSMVGRALACSFACLDEPSDGVTRVRQSNAEESSVAVGSTAGVAESRNGDHSADNLSGEGRRSCGDTGPEMSASGVGVGVGRRRSNRWSRVWDRSITSPLKEFVRKGEHALDRSLSESTRRSRNGDPTDVERETQRGRNGLVSGRASMSAVRSSQAAATSNGDPQNFRTGWLKNKDCRIGRSRSVHYTSPGNFDNGMLRFYLTPMRSNRPTNRGRRRSSRLFARGLFGFVS